MSDNTTCTKLKVFAIEVGLPLEKFNFIGIFLKLIGHIVLQDSKLGHTNFFS